MAEDPATAVRHGSAGLLERFSIEMSAKDTSALRDAAHLIPRGTQVSVTCLARESPASRVEAACLVRRLGFVPVPHVAARRLGSADELGQLLGAFASASAATDVLVVGGDPPVPAGPYADALAVIRTGMLGRYGFKRVSIGAYPEGHPRISTDRLWRALVDKLAALADAGLAPTVVTQLAFSADAVLRWLAELRGRGITAPVQVGVPGPVEARRLLTFARRLGVVSSAGILRKYGRSLTELMGSAGPDRFVESVAQRYDPARHGLVRLHLYTFGAIAETASWTQDVGRTR